LVRCGAEACLTLQAEEALRHHQSSSGDLAQRSGPGPGNRLEEMLRVMEG